MGFLDHKKENEKIANMRDSYFHGISLSDIHCEVSEAIHRGMDKALNDAELRRNALGHQRAVEAQNVVGDASGNVTLRFDGPRQDSHWLIERITTDGTVGAVAVYVGAATTSDLVDFFPSIIKGVHDFNNEILVPGNQPLVCVFSALGAGGAAGINLQYKRIRGNSGASN